MGAALRARAFHYEIENYRAKWRARRPDVLQAVDGGNLMSMKSADEPGLDHGDYIEFVIGQP